jgi:hypothetical protein
MIVTAPYPSLQSALAILDAVYPHVAPSRAFLRQLKALEHRVASAVALSEDKDVDVSTVISFPEFSHSSPPPLSVARNLLLREQLHAAAARRYSNPHVCLPSQPSFVPVTDGSDYECVPLRDLSYLDVEVASSQLLACCRRCRKQTLASNSCVIGPADVRRDTVVRVVPLSWMFDARNGEAGSAKGRLRCPACTAKVGSFDWAGEVLVGVESATDGCSGEGYYALPVCTLSRSAVDWLAR